jgi:hypothetical protein
VRRPGDRDEAGWCESEDESETRDLSADGACLGEGVRADDNAESDDCRFGEIFAPSDDRATVYISNDCV